MSVALKTYKREDLTFDVMSAGEKRKYKYTSSRLCSTKNNQLHMVERYYNHINCTLKITILSLLRRWRKEEGFEVRLAFILSLESM